MARQILTSMQPGMKSPKMNAARLKKMIQLLRCGNVSLAQVGEALGMGSNTVSRYFQAFKAEPKMIYRSGWAPDSRTACKTALYSLGDHPDVPRTGKTRQEIRRDYEARRAKKEAAARKLQEQRARAAVAREARANAAAQERKSRLKPVGPERSTWRGPVPQGYGAPHG